MAVFVTNVDGERLVSLIDSGSVAELSISVAHVRSYSVIPSRSTVSRTVVIVGVVTSFALLLVGVVTWHTVRLRRNRYAPSRSQVSSILPYTVRVY